MKRTRNWLFLATSLVLTASFFSYGYKVMAASQNQIRKEIEITTGEGPGERNIIRLLTPDAGGGFLGVEMADITADDFSRYGLEKEEGVRVVKVEKTSPAADAGILPDDVIVGYAGQTVFSAAQFRRLVTETPVGRKVAVAVIREKKKVDLTAKIGKRETTAHANLFRNLPELPDMPSGVLRGRRWEQGPGNLEEREVRVTVRKPRLGISAIPMTEQLGIKYGVKSGGVLVTEVNKESVAEKAGLKAGDVITSVDGTAVGDLEDIARALDRNEGRSFDMKIMRDMKEVTLKAQLPDAEKERKSGTRVNL